MNVCPSCLQRAVEDFPGAWRCRECGDYGDKKKRESTVADRTARQRWNQFSRGDTNAYQAVQVRAMERHFEATVALDVIYVAPHDAFGRQTGFVKALTR